MSRNREAVKLAAKQSKTAREWLLRDERGTWELRASTLFAYLAEHHPGIAPQVALSAVADKLAFEAVSALLMQARS